MPRSRGVGDRGSGFLPHPENNKAIGFFIYTCQDPIESKGAKIRNRYNQVPHRTQDTNGKVTNSQFYTTKESQEVSPFPAGDHMAHINRRSQRHNKHETEKKHIKDPQKKYRLGTVSKIPIENHKATKAALNVGPLLAH